MNQVIVGGMVNCPKEPFELVRIPMYQDQVCDHVLKNLLYAFAYNERANY
jgi:hypothetical protein